MNFWSMIDVNHRVTVVEWYVLLVGMASLYKSLPRTTEKASQDATFIRRYISVTMNSTARTEVFVVEGNRHLLITSEDATTMACKPRKMKISITLVLK